MTKINCPSYMLLQWDDGQWHVVAWGIDAAEAELKQRLLKAQGQDSLLVKVKPIKASSMD